MSMGIAQMNSLLSSANTLKSVSNLNATRTQMKGQSRILASEIKTDKGRGVNTKLKEDELAETKDRLQGIDENMSNSLTELNKRIESDREKIREEQAEQARHDKKAADSKAKIPTAASSDAIENMPTSASVANEPVDTVYISPEAKAAANTDTINYVANTSDPTIITQSIGIELDKKV